MNKNSDKCHGSLGTSVYKCIYTNIDFVSLTHFASIKSEMVVAFDDMKQYRVLDNGTSCVVELFMVVAMVVVVMCACVRVFFKSRGNYDVSLAKVSL